MGAATADVDPTASRLLERLHHVTPLIASGPMASLVAVFEDHGISGGAPLERRPGLLSAMDARSEHGAPVLLTAKCDRLARDVVVAAMVERLAERQGARVLTADGTGNTEGPKGMLMRGRIAHTNILSHASPSIGTKGKSS